MTLLCVGLDHNSAPMPVLASAALDSSATRELLLAIAADDCVTEAMVLSTCNRIEVYADVERFHAAVDALTELTAKHTGLTREELVDNLRVRYDDAAITHLMSVTCGLESVVPGETQILGQVRTALRAAQDEGTAGRQLNAVVQSALRTGKRVHTETKVAGAGASVVSAGLDLAAEAVGELAGRRAVVVGAGAMGVLAVASLKRIGVDDITVVNRTLERAKRIAATHDTKVAGLDDLPTVLAHAELIVTAVGTPQPLLDAETLLAARPDSGFDGGQLVVIDLALPGDTDESLGGLPGVTRVTLATLHEAAQTEASAEDLAAAQRIVGEEVAEFVTAAAARSVEPTLVALRSHAADVVAIETQRLRGRLTDLSPEEWEEVEKAFRRAVSTLLHTPSVRIKEAAVGPEGRAYAEALRALFDLDPSAIRSVSTPD